LIQKLHTYAGLLAFVNLMVYAIVGISATLGPRRGIPAVSYRAFTVEPNLTDRQVAERVCTLLDLSLATPIQNAAIQHDAARNLLLDFFHANGRHKVTVLEKEGRLRIEVTRNTVWKYLDTLHVTTAVFRSGDWRMQLWAYFNEFAMWCLIAMMASGVAIWLSTRTRRRQKSRTIHLWTALFCLPFLAMYAVTAVQIAHGTWFSNAGLMLTLNRMHRMQGLWREFPWAERD
jgi:hypothetical protein